MSYEYEKPLLKKPEEVKPKLNLITETWEPNFKITNVSPINSFKQQATGSSKSIIINDTFNIPGYKNRAKPGDNISIKKDANDHETGLKINNKIIYELQPGYWSDEHTVVNVADKTNFYQLVQAGKQYIFFVYDKLKNDLSDAPKAYDLLYVRENGTYYTKNEYLVKYRVDKHDVYPHPSNVTGIKINNKFFYDSGKGILSESLVIDSVTRQIGQQIVVTDAGNTYSVLDSVNDELHMINEGDTVKFKFADVTYNGTYYTNKLVCAIVNGKMIFNIQNDPWSNLKIINKMIYHPYHQTFNLQNQDYLQISYTLNTSRYQFNIGDIVNFKYDIFNDNIIGLKANGKIIFDKDPYENSLPWSYDYSIHYVNRYTSYQRIYLTPKDISFDVYHTDNVRDVIFKNNDVVNIKIDPVTNNPVALKVNGNLIYDKDPNLGINNKEIPWLKSVNITSGMHFDGYYDLTLDNGDVINITDSQNINNLKFNINDKAYLIYDNSNSIIGLKINDDVIYSNNGEDKDDPIWSSNSFDIINSNYTVGYYALILSDKTNLKIYDNDPNITNIPLFTVGDTINFKKNSSNNIIGMKYNGTILYDKDPKNLSSELSWSEDDIITNYLYHDAYQEIFCDDSSIYNIYDKYNKINFQYIPGLKINIKASGKTALSIKHEKYIMFNANSNGTWTSEQVVTKNTYYEPGEIIKVNDGFAFYIYDKYDQSTFDSVKKYAPLHINQIFNKIKSGYKAAIDDVINLKQINENELTGIKLNGKVLYEYPYGTWSKDMKVFNIDDRQDFSQLVQTDDFNAFYVYSKCNVPEDRIKIKIGDKISIKETEPDGTGEIIGIKVNGNILYELTKKQYNTRKYDFEDFHNNIELLDTNLQNHIMFIDDAKRMNWNTQFRNRDFDFSGATGTRRFKYKFEYDPNTGEYK